MSRSPSWLRFQHFVGKNAALVVFLSMALVVSSVAVLLTPLATPQVLIAGFNAATASDGPTPANTHVLNLEQNVQAEVINDTAAYENGTVLANQVVYPIENTTDPQIRTVATTQNASVTSVKLTLKLTAQYGSQGGPFYTETNTLAVRKSATEQGTWVVNDTIDPNRLRGRIGQLRGQFGPSVDVTAEVISRATYTYNGSDGSTKEVTQTIKHPIIFDQSVYLLRHDVERTQETSQAGGTGGLGRGQLVANLSLLNLLVSLLGVLSVGLAVATIHTRYTEDLPQLAEQLERARHEEWISRTTDFEFPSIDRVAVFGELVDLVDLAIDKDERVIYDPDRELYFVVEQSGTDTVLYTLDETRGITAETTAPRGQQEPDRRQTAEVVPTVGSADSGDITDAIDRAYRGESFGDSGNAFAAFADDPDDDGSENGMQGKGASLTDDESSSASSESGVIDWGGTILGSDNDVESDDTDSGGDQ